MRREQRAYKDHGTAQIVAEAKTPPVLHNLANGEDIADQQRSLLLFTALGDDYLLGYAKKHHDVIARFGRFPHRNEVLGRTSTLVALADPDHAELNAMQAEFGLHPLAVDDAHHGHQRPKIEEYGDSLFCVLQTA